MTITHHGSVWIIIVDVSSVSSLTTKNNKPTFFIILNWKVYAKIAGFLLQQQPQLTKYGNFTTSYLKSETPLLKQWWKF